MRPSVKDWIAENLPLKRGDRVLDVGSLDVNGTLRDILSRGEYVGADMRPGPNVDAVCFAEDLELVFGRASFDAVVSSDMLEHAQDWRECLSNMKRVLVCGGWICIATVCPGFPLHEFPEDFWRWSPDQLAACFADFENVITYGDVVVLARKPWEWRELDLSGCDAVPVVKPE